MWEMLEGANMSNKKTDWLPVDPTEVPLRTNGGRQPSELTMALIDGKTIFVADWTPKNAGALRAKGSYLRRRGYKVHTRYGERNGRSGLFLWADKERVEPPVMAAVTAEQKAEVKA
jgi:hypothetical protein